MQDIVYYPLSIKRIGRFIYLFFYFASGIGLIYFSLTYKNAFISFFGTFYFVWGAIFFLASILLSLPYVYKKVFIAINNHGVFQKLSFFKKIEFARWENIKGIKVVHNKIEFELENSQMYILTEKMNANDRSEIINTIKFHISSLNFTGFFGI